MDLARLVWVFNTLPLIVVQCRVYEKRKLIGDKTMNSVIGLKGRAHNYPLLSSRKPGCQSTNAIIPVWEIKKSPTKMISKLLINYNNQEPPMKDRPTEVQLGIYVNSFYSISEQTMDYSVSMYLRQRWRDPRLTFSPVYRKTFELRLGDDHVNHVWLPDTFFRNEKRATFHEVTVKNRLMRLNATGHIWYVTKISATLSCPMRLHKYPLDTQSCPMMFESFGYTMDTLYYTWLESPVDIEKNVQLPQFTLQRYIQHDCSQNYTAGAFPCLEIRFILRRDVGYFLIQVYLPSMLIVILSWVSFWINVEASPARVSIGLLTVLTTTTQSTQTAAALPRVSYVKAIDIWMSVCLVFVFAALLEYAVVNVLSRRRVVRRTINNTSTNAASANAAAAAAATSGCSAKRPHLLPVRKLDLRAQLDQTTVVAGVDRRSSQHQQQQLQHQQQLQPLHPQQHHHQQYQSISTRNNAPKPPPDDATGTAVSSVIAKTRRPTTTTSTGDGIDGKTQARRVDWIARKAFPLTFLLFIIIYWIVCTVPIGLSDDGSDA